MYRPLALALIVAALTASTPSRAQLGPGGTQAIQVVDSNGTVMGRWDNGRVDFANGNGVVAVALAQANGTSYLTWSGLSAGVQQIFFTQPGCMGRGWFANPNGSAGALPSALVGPDQQGHFTLYVAESPVVRTILNPTWQSFMNSSGCVRSPGTTGGSWGVLYTDTAPIDLTNLFTAPFHLQ